MDRDGDEDVEDENVNLQFGHGRAAVDNFMGLVLALRCVLFHQRQPAHDDEINDSTLLPRTERQLPEPLPALSNAAQRLLIPLFPHEAHNTWSVMKHQYAYVVRYCGDVADSPYACHRMPSR